MKVIVGAHQIFTSSTREILGKCGTEELSDPKKSISEQPCSCRSVICGVKYGARSGVSWWHCRNDPDVTPPVLIQTLPRNRGFARPLCAFNCPERIASLVTTRQRGPTRRDAENLRQPCRRLRKLPDRLASTNPERTRNRR